MSSKVAVQCLNPWKPTSRGIAWDQNGKVQRGHVIFQCKQWRDPVGASTIRDFRGPMVGRTDKGLVITTSYFTPDAMREATRDEAPAIDLIDGEQLVDVLKKLELGVTTEQVERVTVNRAWFTSI